MCIQDGCLMVHTSKMAATIALEWLTITNCITASSNKLSGIVSLRRHAYMVSKMAVYLSLCFFPAAQIAHIALPMRSKWSQATLTNRAAIKKYSPSCYPLLLWTTFERDCLLLILQTDTLLFDVILGRYNKFYGAVACHAQVVRCCCILWCYFEAWFPFWLWAKASTRYPNGRIG